MLARRIKNFLMSRAFISGISLLIAAIGAFVILPMAYKDQTATLSVVRVKSSIGVGDEITASHIEIIEVGAYNLPAQAIENRDDVLGKYAHIVMLPGDFIFQEKISDYRFDATMDRVLSSGQRLLTITPGTSAAAVSSHLQPGDFVTVSIVKEVRQGGETIYDISAPESVNAVEIYDVETQRGTSLGATKEYGSSDRGLASASGGAQEDLVPRTITLIVTDEQARVLIDAEYTGRIHLVLKERG